MTKERHFSVTGSREHLTFEQLRNLLPTLRRIMDMGFTHMHNGDCINGDHMAACTWRRLRGVVLGHPPEDNKLRAWFHFDKVVTAPAPYAVRNRAMINRAELLLAIPNTFSEVLRSGTWQSVRMARLKGIPRIILLPNGKTDFDGVTADTNDSHFNRI